MLKLNQIKLFLLITLLIFSYINLTQSKEILEYQEEINFGIASKDDRPIFRKLEIENKTKLPIRFDRFIIVNEIGKPSPIFRIDPPNQLPPNGVPFELMPENKYKLWISADLQKTEIGLNRAYLRFFNDRVNDSIEVKLYIVISRDSLIIQIPQITQKLNDTFNLPILIRGSRVSPNIDFVDVTFKFNQSILTPLNSEERGSIENGKQIIKKRFEITNLIREKTTDTVGFISMIVMLGNAIYSDIEITQVDWLKNNIIIPKVPTIISNGKLLINDIFFDDGVPRLVSFNDEFMFIKSFGLNDKKIFLEVEFKGNLPKLQLVDYLGNLIYDNEALIKFTYISMNSNNENKHLFFEFDLNDINFINKHNNLLYFLSLNNNNSIISKKLVILN